MASTSQFDGGGRLASSPASYVVLGLAAGVVLAVLAFWLTLGGFAARTDMRRSTRLILLGTVGAVVLAAGALLFVPRFHEQVPRSHRDCTRPASYYRIHHIDFQKVCGLGGESFAGDMVDGSGGGGGNKMAAIILAAGASLLTLVVLGTTIVIALRRRRSKREPVVENDTAILLAFDESLDDLRSEHDVRRAIVACYARMEFLRRVLERVAREPGQVLTELFERARFSVEPMGEMDKRSAIAALEQLRGRVTG